MEATSPAAIAAIGQEAGDPGKATLGEYCGTTAGLSWEAVTGDVDGPLAMQVRQLAEAEFREDALEIVETGGLWEAMALVDAQGGLAGFVVFGVLGGVMSLRYLSVVPSRRKQGCARLLVRHVVARCVEREIWEVSLFCRRELVGFYRSVGFHEVPEEEGDSEDDLQVPMILRVEGPRLDGVIEEVELEAQAAAPDDD
mmetsp:Transcript_66316/g.154045  ORF Transcript_66316/g.154045 Transcript_66316/m.154045 type:complete len:198 (-) Transcript_66316:71-664(-)